MTIATGTKLGRYEIRSQIGAGGMGEVSEAMSRIGQRCKGSVNFEGGTNDSEGISGLRRRSVAVPS